MLPKKFYIFSVNERDFGSITSQAKMFFCRTTALWLSKGSAITEFSLLKSKLI